MKLYLIGGKARQGKDTLGQYLKQEYEKLGKKVCIMQVSSYIKHLIKDYFGWDGSEETKPRELLQKLGTDIIRVEMNKPLYMINRLIEDMEILSRFFDVIIVTDIRFALEYQEICKVYPAVKIHITRVESNELTANEKKHATETGLDNYHNYDYDIVNDKTLEELEEKAKDIVRKEVDEDEIHDSSRN